MKKLEKNRASNMPQKGRNNIASNLPALDIDTARSAREINLIGAPTTRGV